MKIPTKTQQQGLLALGLVLAAALTRVLPHPLNFTPIGAMALFAGSVFHNRQTGFLLPLMALWISDLVLNNLVYGGHGETVWMGSLGAYLGFTAVFLLGRLSLSRITAGRVLGTSIIASLIFFLVTNGLVWAQGFLVQPPLYPLSGNGLMQTYLAGIPFLGGTLAGDLVYNALLFGAWAWTNRAQPEWVRI